jgi:hypothetical protein
VKLHTKNRLLTGLIAILVLLGAVPMVKSSSQQVAAGLGQRAAAGISIYSGLEQQPPMWD